jgi:short-subunit dehydrogenase involved in D-alanine esterification of teichoic acids
VRFPSYYIVDSASAYRAHPDIDLVIHNAGIQRSVNFHLPELVDLEALNKEMDTNYMSILYVLRYALPYLYRLGSKNQDKGFKNAAVMLVTSGLAITPLVRYGNYCATKAAAHHLIYTLREQLRATNVRVIELIPPAVQSEFLLYRFIPVRTFAEFKSRTR